MTVEQDATAYYGKVVKVDCRGFGYVRSVDGIEYYFHKNAAPSFEHLMPGERVAFGLGPSMRHRGSIVAVDVRVDQFAREAV